MDNFKNVIPVLKQILFENIDKLSLIVDDTMGEEPVFNFWNLEPKEWLEMVNEVNRLVREKITDFDLLKIPYSPSFIAIQGIQSD